MPAPASPSTSASPRPGHPSRPAGPSPTLTAVAVGQLGQLFPDASPAFLAWAVGHHLASSSPSSSGSLAGPGAGAAGRGKGAQSVESVVERVGEKVLDGLGELYPRRRPEEREPLAGRRGALDGGEEEDEEVKVGGLNDDL